MTYEVITFKFHPALACYAQVMHVPNWFERNILQKQSKIITYSGNQSSWMDNSTYNFAPYKITLLLTEYFHTCDLENFKKEMPMLAEFTKSFLAFIFKNKNQ